MKDIGVLVVPETPKFALKVSRDGVVWINKKLGKPKLSAHNAKYLVPFWLKEPVGATRIYHILKMEEHNDCYGIYLGNSFILSDLWQGIAQKRRFEYWELSDFGFVEICPGLLTSVIK